MTDLHWLTLSEVCRRIKSGELTSKAVTEHTLKRIGATEDRYRAFVTVTAEAAMASAERLDAARAKGEPLGPLHGVPIALKDLLWTRGVKTTCGTKVLANWVPDEDSTTVTRLKEAGAVIIGKVKLTEGAFSDHHPEVDPPRNVWDPAVWPGVSSSGSGVAVGAGLAYGAIGTDTGGSIRFPSASNGIVGIKPTYGRVSRYGAFPLAESLDHVGPMTRSVEDAARMLGVLAGHDKRDPTSIESAPPNYGAAIGESIRGMRIGIDRSYAEDGVAADVVASLKQALATLVDLGAEVVEVALPPYRALVQGWGVTCGVETALAHAQYFPARRADYGPVLARLIDGGLAAPATAYAALERARERFRTDLEALLRRIDVIAAPAMVFAPPRMSQMASLLADGVADFITFTAPFNYSGHPTITLPSGFNGDGLPMAFQLIGRFLGEPTLIRAGHAYEHARGPLRLPAG
ncbi:MAG TPA: amidase [Pseudomonadales bacterium]|nr:amidase [Pseudomonadales bacterium]